MVLFNYSTKELTAKIVYYGPGLCGKTTNLQYIFKNLPTGIQKGKMLSLATKTDRTLFFDFLPIDLGTIRGMRTRLQLYTVPGQVFYNTTRKLVLKGADGVVFVADSQKKMVDADVESFANLEENLAEHGMKLAEMPHIIQFNKRDLPGVGTTEELNAALNKYNAPIYEAVATSGIGVHDTLKAVTRLVLNSLKTRYGDSKRVEREPVGAVATQKAEVAMASMKSAPRAEAPPAPMPVAVEEEAAAIEIEEVDAQEPMLTAEADEPLLSIETEEETPLLAVEEDEPPVPIEAVTDIAIDDSPLALDEPDSERPAPAREMDTDLDIESPLPEPADESVQEDPSPIVLSQPESFEVETASVDPPAVSASAPRAVVAPSFTTSAETRAIHSAPAAGRDPAGRETTIPISVTVQGQTLQIMLTISVRVEKT